MTALGEVVWHLCETACVLSLGKGRGCPVSGSMAANVGEERIAGLSPLYLLLHKSIHTE